MNGKQLKLIAIITMVIDHIGASCILIGLYRTNLIYALDARSQTRIYVLYTVLRKIGRISFPFFCFLLVEGFLHTRNKLKYAVRLAVFALVSEIPFDLAFENQVVSLRNQNVMLTLLIAFFVLWGMETLEKLCGDKVLPGILVQLIPAAIGAGLAYLLHTDYDWKGILIIAAMYLFRTTRLMQCGVGAAAFLWEWTAPLAFIPIYFYNGERGKQNKWFFYIFYPAHLMVLWAFGVYGIPMLIG